jgi:site-specific recombinase XerD
LLNEVKAVAVEEWLSQLSMACGTKAKLRNIMSAIFKHAMRHEWADKNPISLVRQSAKRKVIPAVLDLTEISVLLSTLEHPFKQMVFLAQQQDYEPANSSHYSGEISVSIRSKSVWAVELSTRSSVT